MRRRQFLTGTAGIMGSMLAGRAYSQVRPCPPPTFGVQGGTSASTTCSSLTAEADWLLRSGQDPANPQPGVVWFHDFRSDAEVNAFRWTDAYKGGNDPLGKGLGGLAGSQLRRNTTDGVTGACLEILRPAGSQDPPHWWRPLSPLTAPGNGKSADDPAANRTVTIQPWSPTDGSQTTQLFGRRGYYGHSSYFTKEPSAYDGSEFWLQMRVKMDPRRMTRGNTAVGKLQYLSITDYSLSGQEIVTYSGGWNGFGTQGYTGQAGDPNTFQMYGLGNFTPLSAGDSLGRPGDQVGSALANYSAGTYCRMLDNNNPANCWYWSGGWDTIMYHLIPGRSGVKETKIEVYAAHSGEKTWTKIWDEIFTNGYDSTTPQGYNALILSAYQNGFANSEFYHRYCQIIFSKQAIPCPQA